MLNVKAIDVDVYIIHNIKFIKNNEIYNGI